MSPAARAARPRLPSLADLTARALPLLGRAPFRAQAVIVGQALNHLFGEAARRGELDFLSGRCLAIEVSDAAIRWPISVEAGRIVLGPRDQEADACIRGRSATFLALANRRADPDTLFFQRRLAMEGDTELGLYLKNWLDTLDPDALPALLRHGLRAAEKLLAPEDGD